MTNAFVYIDVDGVLNSFEEKRSLVGWTGDWRVAKVMGYNIHWYTDLVDELNKLATMENVTVKWLTTWQDKAASELSEALGIEGQFWDVLYHDESKGEHLFNRQQGWWKLNAIIKDIAIHTPDKVVWIDDDFKYEANAMDWAIHVPAHSPLLIHPVSPDGDLGMTKEEFDGIIEFINA